MASDMMAAAALGRPFTLGMLYDARKDEVIPGFRLWDGKALQERITESPQRSSAFAISASDSIESKSSLLKVDASLKASFMCGLFEVEGSAEYLNDKKKFKNQSRVTFQYKATTHFKELSLTHLSVMNPQQINVIKKGLATHVVTGILYGANAFFVFDSEKLEASSVRDKEVKMKAVIQKIPDFNIQGKVDIKLTEAEKALTQTFSCKFYGDFILESNPATFEEAVKTYAQLPKLLGQNGENAVPVKVWLMPLKNLDSEAAELTSGISVGLVRKAQDTLEDLREIGIRCNDSQEDRVVEKFQHIQEELSTFQKLCGDYVCKLQNTMAEKLPSIREGKEDERSVEQLFEDRDKSLFSHDKLSKWLDRKEREINVIRSCVDTMEGAKVVLNQSELDREILAPGVEHVLCFVFTSMKRGDTLNSPKMGSTDEEQWYSSDGVVMKMRKKAKAFRDLAKALKKNSRFCFLVAAIENKKYTGATIYHYKDGILDTEDFSKPDLPDVETITDRRDLIWYACDLTLDPNTANNYITLSEGNKKATCGAWQTYPDHPERFSKYPQALCKEKLNKRHYWEVELSTGSIESSYVAASYKRIERKGSGPESVFGSNTISWTFGQYLSSKIRSLRAWHDGMVWEIPFPSSCCNVIGVFLDWPAGTMSFYRVSSNTLSHLYTFHNTFTEPVYPGIWANKYNNFVYLRPVE
ncbi:neoverrucotoxin subunit beta-like [Epinephelus lanceolatus]